MADSVGVFAIWLTVGSRRLFFHCNTMHQSFPNNSQTEPRWCYLNAFDSVHNAQFYKDNAAPAPMVPDHAVLEWGVLHRQLMQESDVSRHDILAAIWLAFFSRCQRYEYRCRQGDLGQTLRNLKSHSELVELLPSSHGVEFATEDWNDTKKKLCARPRPRSCAQLGFP